jgi:hypothetical protein
MEESRQNWKPWINEIVNERKKIVWKRSKKKKSMSNYSSDTMKDFELQ